MQPSDVGTYHPVYVRPSDSWYPANRTADLLIHLDHIWGDILKLNDIRLMLKDDNVGDRLLLKHIIVEFRSLLEPLKGLQTIVMRADPLVAGKPAPFRYVTKLQRETCKAVFKEFWHTLREVERDIFDIRNNIGAHRAGTSWQKVEELWDKLDAERFTAAMNAFLPVWESLRGLNIFEWSRNLNNGNVSILGGAIVHDWNNAYTEQEIQKADTPTITSDET